MKRILRLLALLLLPGVASAVNDAAKPPAPTVQVNPADEQPRQIDIVGVAEGRQATYTGGIWLMATANVELALVPSPLEGDGLKVPVSSIRVNSNAPFALQIGTPRLLTVSVDTDLSRGLLHGALKLSSTSSPSVQFPPISISLSLTPKPNIATLPAPLSFKATRCLGPLSCGIARLLVPSGEIRSALHWQLADYAFSGASVQIPAIASLHDDKGGDVVYLRVGKWSDDESAVLQPLDTALPRPNEKAMDAAFRIDPLWTAGHYQGQYSISVKDAALLTVPISLDVRDGPLLALGVLILGIFLGRVIQATNSARAQSQMKLLDRYNSISSAVSAIQYAPNRRLLEISLEDARVDIRLMSRSEQDITNELDLIDKLAADSLKLDMLTAQIVNEADPDREARLQAALDAARAAINAKDIATADTKIAQVVSLLAESAGALQRAAAATADAVPVPARDKGMRVGSLTRETATAAPARKGLSQAMAKALSWLSGTEPLGVGWYYYGRPLLFFLLLVLLAFVGLYNSYIRNATFGAEGIYDYMSLFLWGISADVAQKSLQQLSLTRAAA
jgi:hypothetical protein